MSRSVKISKLITKLKNSKDSSDIYNNPLHFLEDQPETIVYLFKHIVTPICNGETVQLSNIDMSKFERGDIETVWTLYQEHMESNSTILERLRKFYQTFKSASPSFPRGISISLISISLGFLLGTLFAICSES